MRFLRLLILIPALCLGLLGQGHGWVLCQEACGCVHVEAAHDAHAHEGVPGDACAKAEAQSRATGAHGQSGKCHDLTLDAGTHVAPKPAQMPNLALFAVALLDWGVRPVPFAPRACGLPHLARGPPGTSPPQILRCLRGVVMLV